MRILLGLVCLLVVSCANEEMLRVRQFPLRETEVDRNYFRSSRENQFIRGEINNRVYGAVTKEEREARKGDYYTVSWDLLGGREKVGVIFEYRQTKTGADVKRMKREFPASVEGKTEFQVIGEAFQKGGRVLAWRMTLLEGGKTVAVKKSYLWD
ncbi:MAG: hypothetical protein ACSHYF_06175 [Verrucomicrobiaceae bacterium]